MARLLVWASFTFVVVISLLLTSICFVGRSIKSPAAEIAQQFDCMSGDVCWHSIHLGVSTISEAITLLKMDNNIALLESTETYVCWGWQNQLHTTRNWAGCYTDLPNANYELILNYAQNTLRLGDIMPLLHNAVSSALCTDLDVAVISSPGVRVAVNVAHGQRTWLDLNLTVDHIEYFYPRANPSKETSIFHPFGIWSREGICAG